MRVSSKYSLGIKLGLGQGALILLVMAISTWIITAVVTERAAREAEEHLSHQADALVTSMSSYHAALDDSADKLALVFRSYFPGPFAVNPSRSVDIAGKPTPVLTSGSTILNLNTQFVDHFTSVTHAVATILVRSGDDFIRISTSLNKEDGSRAIGTALDREHPAYNGLLKGDEFVGKATLFGRDYMTKYLPIKDRQGNVVGVLFIGLDFTDELKSLKDKIKSMKVGKSGYIFALEAKPGKDLGKLLIHPAKEGQNILDSTDARGKKFIREIIERKNGIIRYPWINKEMGDSSPREKIAAYRHFKQWNWVIGVGSYLDEFNGIARLVRNTIILAMALVGVLLLSLLTVLIRHWVTRPIRELVQQTERFASRDFSRITAITQEGNQPADEVAQLSEGVNKMASSLKATLSQVMASAREVGSAAGQVNEAAARIAQGSDEIVGKTVSVATAGEEMSATSGDIAQNCQIAVEEAQRATLSAQKGTEVVNNTVVVMDRIALKVQESTATVERLGARGDQIGQIIGTIEDIADQTNLLALNAAIEAARAGEQGRGFAVVADEVRALAERTTAATHEIGKMIKAIQTETQEAVAVMEEGVHQVQAGTSEAAKSGEALMGIMEQISAFTMQINQIATAAEEQSVTTAEISDSIHQVTTVVQNTATGAHASAAAAGQLNNTAKELERLVNQFKLG